MQLRMTGVDPISELSAQGALEPACGRRPDGAALGRQRAPGTAGAAPQGAANSPAQQIKRNEP